MSSDPGPSSSIIVGMTSGKRITEVSITGRSVNAIRDWMHHDRRAREPLRAARAVLAGLSPYTYAVKCRGTGAQRTRRAAPKAALAIPIPRNEPSMTADEAGVAQASGLDGQPTVWEEAMGRPQDETANSTLDRTRSPSLNSTSFTAWMVDRYQHDDRGVSIFEPRSSTRSDSQRWQWTPRRVGPLPDLTSVDHKRLAAMPTLALISSNSPAVTILASAIAASIVLPILGRGLATLPTWGLRVLEWRNAVWASRRRRRLLRRRSKAVRRPRESKR